MAGWRDLQDFFSSINAGMGPGSTGASDYALQGYHGRWQDMPGADMTQEMTAAAEKYGLGPADMLTAARIESSFNPNAKNGQHVGLYQMSPAFAKEWGVQDRNSPVQAIDGAGRAFSATRDKMLSQNGYAPSMADVYMAHQQGPKGARDLMQAPQDARAMDVRPPQAIAGNVPPGVDPAALTVQEFRDLFGRKFQTQRMARALGGF